MRVVQLLPQRAFGEQNANQEMKALKDAGHEVLVVVAPYFGIAGIVWFETVGYHQAIQESPDVVSCRDLDALGAGVKVKRRTGAKLVYDMHEVYSYMVEDDVPKHLLPFIEKRERRLLRDVDLALASDTGREQWLADQGYVFRPREVILNCRDPLPYMLPPNDGTLFYAGTLHRSRFIRGMVQAMAFFPDKRLVIAGPRTPNSEYDWLKENYGVGPEGAYGDEPIVFLGQLNSLTALDVLQRSDVSIQMADPTSRINRLGPYNRLFDAMTAGRPSIGTLGTANGALIDDLGIGLCSTYDLGSYVATLKAFFSLFSSERERMGKNAHRACFVRFNWKSQAKKLVRAYEAL